MFNSHQVPRSHQRYLWGYLESYRSTPGIAEPCLLQGHGLIGEPEGASHVHCCREGDKKDLYFFGVLLCVLFFCFVFLTCRSFKSSNSVMNIHFNVVLKIQLMTPQRENDPGIKEINI